MHFDSINKPIIYSKGHIKTSYQSTYIKYGSFVRQNYSFKISHKGFWCTKSFSHINNCRFSQMLIYYFQNSPGKSVILPWLMNNN